MPEVEVKDLKNEVVGKLELVDQVFQYEASPGLLWEAVRAFQAAQRKGTHSTKNRSAARGGGQKPWRQKGTGRARVGSVRSPLWRGGGSVNGPHPRDYRQAIPKKKRRGAIRLVLTDKLKNKKLAVLESLELESHRTKDFLEVLDLFEINGKALIVDDRSNRNLYLGSRNVPNVKMVATEGVNLYDLLNYEHLLISKEALLKLQEVLRK